MTPRSTSATRSKPGSFLTKFHVKVFAKEEMIKDLDMVETDQGKVQEYFRILPRSPP